MRRKQLLLRTLLISAILCALGALSQQHRSQFDWTASKRNTLTSASAALLDTMPDAISATAYVVPDKTTEQNIAARFAPYQRVKDNFSLQFIDPATAPQVVRELGIADSGEVLLSYQGRRESIQIVGEVEISQALQRLAHAQEARLLYLSGHGERSPDDEAPAGFSEFSQALNSKGIRSTAFTLALQSELPEQDLLVIAAPQRELLAGEVQRLSAYLANGGNLLWLFDPDSPRLPPLEKALSLQALPGNIVYQDYELLGTGHPALTLVAEYSDHASMKGAEELSVFPLTGGLQMTPGSDWFADPILRSVDRSWLENGPLEGPLSFDATTEVKGPIDFGLALERHVLSSDKNQRVVVIADSDFLSNAFIHQLGNRALGLSITQWLLGRDEHINIDIPAAPDTSLQLSPRLSQALALWFIALLPGGLLGFGLLRWFWRQRQR